MQTGNSRAAARGVTFGLGLSALLASTILTVGAQSAPPKPAVDKSVKVADGVYEVVAGTDAVYVASTGRRGPDAKPEARIVVLDPKTLDVKKSIDVTAEPAFGLGLNEKTQMLYTSNTRSGSVSVIDLKAGKVVATIKSEADPKAHTFRVLADEANNKVYVSLASKDGKTLDHRRQDQHDRAHHHRSRDPDRPGAGRGRQPSLYGAHGLERDRRHRSQDQRSRVAVSGRR